MVICGMGYVDRACWSVNMMTSPSGVRRLFCSTWYRFVINVMFVETKKRNCCPP